MANPDNILNLIEAFRRSKVLFTAESLGVFDRLSDGMTGDQLATVLGANQDALERLLDACAGLGLLQKQDGLYRNTPEAERFLRSDSPDTLSGYVRYSDTVLYPLWAKLKDAVLEGSNRWEQVFGGRGALFEHFYRQPETKRAFLAGMNGFGQLSSAAVVRAFDLSGFRHLVDLGGATGHLAIAACEAYPQLRATVFDLPGVIPISQEYISQSKAAERLATQAGDFFNDELPQGDLYCLGRIVHDWSEDNIILLLNRIYAALPEEGALLIAEKILDEDHLGPVNAQLQSLNMLACTDGKERSLSEYRALLHNSGFTHIEGRRTGTLVDAILAYKRSAP